MKPDILARLNPKTTCYGEGGGGAVITNEDLSYALAPATHLQQAIGFLKYAAHKEYRVQVMEWLLAVAINRSEKWHKATFDQKIAISVIVIDDLVPDNRCEKCNGRQVVPGLCGIPQICDLCGGRGWIIRSQEAKAQLLGVDPSNYRKTWRGREEQLKAAFDEQDYQILKLLNDRIFE